jgi:glycine hydroxymethyltransferase
MSDSEPAPTAPHGAAPPRRTVLYDRHLALGARMAPFAGWEMPIEYKAGIFREHAAVRAAAGLFDVSHMGILQFSGPKAAAFLDMMLTSAVTRLMPGRAQYSCLLQPDGTALDDLFVYRLSQSRFLLVVNAANAQRDAEHLQAALANRLHLPQGMPPSDSVSMRDLRGAGQDALVLLALQGPASKDLLLELTTSDAVPVLRGARRNEVLRLELAGLPVLAASTGYTGEETGFELFVHPDQAGQLWDLLLDRGRAHDVLPCGLGARDSLRIEAGLPLFGHELEGPERLTPTEAGYGFVVRMDKAFFVGREAYGKRISPLRKRLLRLRGRGRRSVRAGHVVLDQGQRPAGVVTSFAFTAPDFTFHVLASVRADFDPPVGAAINAVRTAADRYAGPPEEDKLVSLTVLPRFPTREERAGWGGIYNCLRPG